ncbi:MAG: fluoride efflux transporter CrcB [Bacteroidia bacterium]
MKLIAYIALGGAFGALLRYGVGLAIKPENTLSFPIHTFLINVAGCLLIGIAAAVLQTNSYKEFVQYFVIIGLLGGFTTFSSFSFESFALLKNGKLLIAAAYITLSNTIGIVAAFAGYYVHQLLIKA